MANTYKTPGVYVEEIPKLPPSVADVPTAIPAFIGYTAKATKGSEAGDLLNKPTKITSLLDYERIFGKGPELTVNTEGIIANVGFVLYDSIRLFYDNGGGICYIVSIGDYKAKEFSMETYKVGLDKVRDIDEVTLLVMPDATTLLDAEKLGNLQKQALLQCKELQDRFSILDVKEGGTDDTTDSIFLAFRNNIGQTNADYGAAYYPYVSTVYKHEFTFKDVISYIINKYYSNSIKNFSESLNNIQSVFVLLRTLYKNKKAEIDKYIKDVPNHDDLKKVYQPEHVTYNIVKSIVDCKTKCKEEFGFEQIAKDEREKKYKELTKGDNFDKSLKDYIIEEIKKGLPINKTYTDSLFDPTDETGNIEKASLFLSRLIILKRIDAEIVKTDSDYLNNFILKITEDCELTLKQDALKSYIPEYNSALSRLAQESSIIPPSGAIAGIYAQSDNFSGVWNAPANMNVNSIKGVSRLINNQMQEDMNVTSTGLSINAIRAFSGKGIMVWGARTLAGNNNEWRYVPVRRLFIYVEESVKKSTEWAVFSPNTQNTWTKIKSQIENFLINVWRAGGLAGSTPAEAFFVSVGLGTTMDYQDILEGRLIVEIGMAAVRPAEFIILRFSHKVQES